MKQFNSDKKISSINQSDKLKSILYNNVKKNDSYKEDNLNNIITNNNHFDENKDVNNKNFSNSSEEIGNLLENRIDFNEPENELFSEDEDNGINEKSNFSSSQSKSKNYSKQQTKPKLSFKTIFINSDFYIFFKVWLNLNRWGIFFYLIMTSATIVYFVSNVMKVNRLLGEIRMLNKVKNEINGKNKILEVKLVEMQAPERINKIATESMGFQKATEAPFYIKNTIQK